MQRSGGGAHTFTCVWLLSLPLPFPLSGDETHVSRGLGHFVCILTLILRFAAKRQSIKVLPLKKERSGNKLSAEGHLGKKSFEHLLITIYLRLIEINCSKASTRPRSVLKPQESFMSSHIWVNKYGSDLSAGLLDQEVSVR